MLNRNTYGRSTSTSSRPAPPTRIVSSSLRRSKKTSNVRVSSSFVFLLVWWGLAVLVVVSICYCFLLSSSPPVMSDVFPTPNRNMMRPQNCHFEDANGYYQKGNNNNNGSWTWNWIHNTTTATSKTTTLQRQTSTVRASSPSSSSCTITNHLEAIRTNRYHHPTNKPLVFLTLGDSLDRNIVLDHICAKWEGFHTLDHDSLQEDHGEKVIINTAPYNQSTCGICTNDQQQQHHSFSFAFFKLYGMHHDCENNGMLRKEDSRTTESTADRVMRFLGPDVLWRLGGGDDTSGGGGSNIVVLIGSSLWDLSDGNCNNRPTISQRYQILYRQGIIALHEAIRTLLPESPVYWRTSPAVSEEYNEMATWQKWGRNRANQETLNALLRDTVSQEGLGAVVDWWHQANQRPEAERGINRDGRHYEEGPSLAFYNLFLNAVFDHHPWLLEP